MKHMLSNTWARIGLGVLLSAVLLYFVLPLAFAKDYDSKKNEIPEAIPAAEQAVKELPAVELTAEQKDKLIPVTHRDTPAQVKAVYMSSWVAGTNSFRKKIVDIIKRTELNTVIIDVKDYSGKISFPVNDPYLQEIGSSENRVRDIRAFIAELHAENIYVIARIAVFQDPYLAKKWRDQAVMKSDKVSLWEDNKCKREIARGKESQCTYWLDTGSQKVWEYAVAIGKEAYAVGFDELNYDYIRFPADGNMKDIYFPISGGVNKPQVLENFFSYLYKSFAGEDGTHSPRPKLSGDIFGMTMTNTDDLNIGQVLERAAPYFDYLGPMVYPSHFPNGWNNFSNPATKPYEVIKVSMSKGAERLKAIGQDPKKLRPWLQDFNLGATYTPEMVRAQIQGTYDAGLDSWMLWDPGNTYTEAALLKE